MLLLAGLAVVEGSDVAMRHGLPGEPGADATSHAAIMQLSDTIIELKAEREARAKHFDALVEALGDLADCVWFKQTTSAEVDRALAALAKARAPVPADH